VLSSRWYLKSLSVWGLLPEDFLNSPSTTQGSSLQPHDDVVSPPSKPLRMIKVMPEKRTEAAKPAQAAEQPAPKKLGRPTNTQKSWRSTICTRITNGESLRNICREAGMPTYGYDLSLDWSLPLFSDQYARAREEQADTLADEIQALSDEPPPMVLGKFGEVIDTGWLQWQKQRIDSRKWCAPSSSLRSTVTGLVLPVTQRTPCRHLYRLRHPSCLHRSCKTWS
jgi:hypothetical protein